MAKSDHLQCGCKNVRQTNLSLVHGDTNTEGKKCVCTSHGNRKMKNIKEKCILICDKYTITFGTSIKLILVRITFSRLIK